MTRTVMGYHEKAYLIAVHYYAKRMGADTLEVNKNGTINLYCEDGIICEEYLPTAKELAFRKEQWHEGEDYLIKR